MAKTMASLQAFPCSLLPRTWSRALIPFPFPFERLPRRLRLRETAQQFTVAAGLRGKNKQSRGFDHAQ